MNAILIGGLYDGITLDHNDVKLYARFCPVGVRKFIALPPRPNWGPVRRGDLGKDGPFTDERSVYELVRIPVGTEGQYDADGSILATATEELAEDREVVPEVEFTGQYFKCYRGDLRDVSLPANHFAVTDERNRDWVRIAVSGEAGDGDGFAEMVSYMGGEPLSEPLRMTKLHCMDKSELPAKLADQIDLRRHPQMMAAA